jgi:hypothetical protein
MLFFMRFPSGSTFQRRVLENSGAKSYTAEIAEKAAEFAEETDHINGVSSLERGGAHRRTKRDVVTVCSQKELRFFAPSELTNFRPATHGLRRGLYSFAASRLK